MPPTPASALCCASQPENPAFTRNRSGIHHLLIYKLVQCSGGCKGALFLMFGDAAQILKLFLGLDTNIIFYLPFSINSGINISDAHSEVKTMNIVHSTQEKRTIKVKDFLEYFRAGCTDTQLMEKFHLTPAGLDRFYGLLLERQILRSADFEGRTESTMEKAPERVAQDYEQPRLPLLSRISGNAV